VQDKIAEILAGEILMKYCRYSLHGGNYNIGGRNDIAKQRHQRTTEVVVKPRKG